MPDRRAQERIGLVGRSPSESPGDEVANVPLLLGRRVVRPHNAISFLLALVVLYLMYRQLLGLDWHEAWASIRGANGGLLAFGLVIFYCAFAVRALRWKVLLGNVGYDRAAGYAMPSILGLARIMYLAWFANCVTIARLGDVYRGYLLKKTAGVSFTVTLGTVLAERFLDLAVVAAMMGAGVLAVFGGSLPTEATRVLAVGLVLSVVGVAGLLLMRRLRGTVERVLPKRLHTHYARLEHGLVGSFGRFPMLLLACSTIGWIIEGATLYVTAAAVGTPVSIAGALVVALAAALLTTVPFTPAGLGFTETGMVLMLQWLGLGIPAAGAVTLLFRIINYWSIIVLGFVLYVSERSRSRLTEERWGTHG
jgi:uncharacterized protein (TIRG00374 family)